MPEKYREKFLAFSLTETIEAAPGLDQMSEIIFELQEALESRLSLGDFLAICRGRGLSTAALENALDWRALACHERDRELGN